MIEVEWAKTPGGGWFNLWIHPSKDHNLEGKEGIYIIFDSNNLYVFVGRGMIKEHLLRHQQSYEFKEYPADLWYTWAELSHYYQVTIERYLITQLVPKLNHELPNPLEGQVAINLPY